MSDKCRVLFICVHNSGRSQMAETFLSTYGGDRFEVASAGLEPEPIDPLVVEVMKEEGYDLSQKKSQSVFAMYKEGRLFDYVITVCDDAHESECPIFPGVVRRWHWPFPDPALVRGSREQRLDQVRQIRDAIKARLLNPENGDELF